jgi:hypothetical protein
MRGLARERLDLIEALAAEADIGGVTAALLEKDEHLTDALRALFGLKFEHATLVFCGGTSLSKAHQLIERMSEDADLKVVMADSAVGWSKSRLRRYLGDEVRNRVLTVLSDMGFVEEPAGRCSLNDNRYFQSQWRYAGSYEGVAALRPHLQIELVVRAPVLPIESAKIGALSDRLAGRTGSQTTVPVLAVAETMAEKVLSFLRRFALRQLGDEQPTWDTALVRHVYDTHCIVSQMPGSGEAAADAFIALVSGDVADFGYQHPGFAADPKAVLMHALEAAKNDEQTRLEYSGVLLPLVYGKNKPAFHEAWRTFYEVAHRLLKSL